MNLKIIKTKEFQDWIQASKLGLVTHGRELLIYNGTSEATEFKKLPILWKCSIIIQYLEHLGYFVERSCVKDKFFIYSKNHKQDFDLIYAEKFTNISLWQVEAIHIVDGLIGKNKN